MKKRILPFALALVLLLGAALPAFAEDAPDWQLLFDYESEHDLLCVLLPARFVRFAQEPQLSLLFEREGEEREPLVLSGDELEACVIDVKNTACGAPQLAVKATVPREKANGWTGILVPENTAFDSTGNGNEAVTLQGGIRLNLYAYSNRRLF